MDLPLKGGESLIYSCGKVQPQRYLGRYVFYSFWSSLGQAFYYVVWSLYKMKNTHFSGLRLAIVTWVSFCSLLHFTSYFLSSSHCVRILRRVGWTSLIFFVFFCFPYLPTIDLRFSKLLNAKISLDNVDKINWSEISSSSILFHYISFLSA